MPSRRRASINRFSDLSIVASVIKPFFTASTNEAYAPPHSMSHPEFTANAEASAGVGTTLWPA